MLLDPLERADLIDALQDAYDDLQYRLDNHKDYDEADTAAADAKLERWTALIARFVAESAGKAR